jgi:hypothetical protein
VAGCIALSCGGDDDDEGSGDATPVPSVLASATGAPATAVRTPPATPPGTPGGAADRDRAVAAARSALARWLGPVGNPASISVASVEEVTWGGGCLELNRPGQACTGALVAGFRIRLQLANATYEVRTDRAANTVLWAPARQVLVRFAEASPNVIEFTTDDGGRLVVQVVPGSDLSVPATMLSPGDAVGIGLADSPQSGGQLLVSLDRVE